MNLILISAARLNGAIQGVIYKKLVSLKNGGDNLSAQISNIITNDLERVTEAVVSACFMSGEFNRMIIPGIELNRLSCINTITYLACVSIAIAKNVSWCN